MQVHANEGGVTQTRGGIYWLILPAGCTTFFLFKILFRARVLVFSWPVLPSLSISYYKFRFASSFFCYFILHRSWFIILGYGSHTCINKSSHRKDRRWLSYPFASYRALHCKKCKDPKKMVVHI